MKKVLGWLFVILIVLGVVVNMGDDGKVKDEKEKVVKEEDVGNDGSNDNKDGKIDNEDDEFAKEKAYTEKLSFLMTTSGGAMSEISSAFAESSNDPTLLSDSDWRQRIVNAYAILSQDYKELSSYKNVPKKFEKVHNLTLEYYELLMKSRDRVLQGIDMKDANHLLMGADLISQANEKLSEVTFEMQFATD